MNGPAGLPPSPAAVADYFGRKLCTISEFSPDGILHNERLWVVETCGLPESELDPPPIITREQAARLDDPFSDKRNFGPRGQYAKCAGCGAVFESLGLRLCAGCNKLSHASQPKRCQWCEAPLHPGGRKTLKFCSGACKQKAHRGVAVTDRDDANASRRLPGPPTPVTVTLVQADQGLTDRPSRNTTAVRCAGCRREFQPTRKDTKFCSAACKQRAYRLGKVVEAQQLALEGAFGVTQTLAAQAAPAGLAY